MTKIGIILKNNSSYDFCNLPPASTPDLFILNFYRLIRHCLEKRSSNERLDTNEMKAVFRDHEDNRYAASKDKERNRDRSRSCERHRERERDRDWHHYSKSSGNSRRSSRHRHRHRHRRSHHHSDSVWKLSVSVCRGNCHLSLHFFLVIWTVGIQVLSEWMTGRMLYEIFMLILKLKGILLLKI